MTAKCKKISILLAALFFWIVSNQLWLGLSVTSKKLPKVAQNDFTRKMIDFGTFTKIA